MGISFSRLFSQLWSKEEMRILMLGLDASGKTTVLFKLKMGEVYATIPTIGFNVETLEYKNIRFTVWDVGGQTIIRKLWSHYYPGTRALIYLVDSSDVFRMEEAKETLHHIISHDALRDAILLVFANKQDLPNALNVSEIASRLELNSLPATRKWYIHPTCAHTGDGLYEGLDWLSNALKSK